MKPLLLLLSITFAHHLAAFEGGYIAVDASYTTEDLPERGKMVSPVKKGNLFFYLPRVYEVFVAEDGDLSVESKKRKRHFSSSGLFYSKDGKEWFLGGEGLHFVEVWTHPTTGEYFATIGGITYIPSKGKLLKKVSCHIVVSENATDWTLIQGDLDPFHEFPRFFVDPVNDTRVCLFYYGRNIRGSDWRIAQSADKSYSEWRMFDSGTWKHREPTQTSAAQNL